MPNTSSEFSEMRFQKSVRMKNRNFTLNADMYRLFFTLDENKTMSQVASQHNMDLFLIKDCVLKLWSQGLIEPVGLTNLWVDRNFAKLIKIILFYITGHKTVAYDCVDGELEKLGFSQDRLPANRAPDLVAAVSTKISNPETSKHFRDFLADLIPIRTQMKAELAAGSDPQALAVSNGTIGKTRQIIDRIIAARSGGNPILAKNARTKLMLKGINPDSYLNDTLDNPKTLAKLRRIAETMGVDIEEQRRSGVSEKASRGQIWNLIIRIINERSRGNPTIAKNIHTKLILKGIDVDGYGPDTPDNPLVLDRVRKLATSMGVSG